MDLFVSLISIVTVNLLLSGDNALVIALASRSLPPAQQQRAVFWGGAGAVVLRVVLTLLAIILLNIPYLQLIGGFALLWIAVKLLAGEEEKHTGLDANPNLWGAVKTIIAADLVMSIDNVIAIAGVAKGNIVLLIIGLAISIPIIIWGSKVIHILMARWPVVITIGAAFLGWTAGGMAITDQKLQPLLVSYPWLDWAIPLTFAVFVILLGEMLLLAKGEENI
ncbi:MAG TPA: TerC family protein [Methylomusa anaerophila]|uniref:Integral membrane protein TerC family protein n=1 Tax=Methylomusa anaerophila TaxID=1930071 RepID=A0A348AF71_9FIRM|nr:TerC family protein [Methylomusa anaerophila]BBB89719.1 integral membrane protein TerC family protein [Methylomusa anaerophila]HML89236.1 TerC family protein [Methylomusa anaerophila]